MLIGLFILAFIIETAVFGWKAAGVEEPPAAALSLDFSGSGSTNPAAGTHILEKGKLVIVEAVPGEGWVFSHWVGPVSEEKGSRTTVALDEDVAIRAVFIEEDGEAGLYEKYSGYW